MTSALELVEIDSLKAKAHLGLIKLSSEKVKKKIFQRLDICMYMHMFHKQLTNKHIDIALPLPHCHIASSQVRTVLLGEQNTGLY